MTAPFRRLGTVRHLYTVLINALVPRAFSLAVARRRVGAAADRLDVASLPDVVGERRARHHVLPAIGAADLVVDADRHDVARARLVAGVGGQRHLADQDDRDKARHGAIVTRQRLNRKTGEPARRSPRPYSAA